MTMKVQEQTITIQRKNHPNDVRYPCRPTHEVLEAGRKFITSLSPQERNLLLKNDLILDENETSQLFDEFKENDIIGLGILRKDGFHSNMYRIEKIHVGEDWMECENAYSKEIEDISFQDVSTGIALGFAEILYREDKPYGVSDSYEFTIKYETDEPDPDVKEKNEIPTQSGTDASSHETDSTNEGLLSGGEKNLEVGLSKDETPENTGTVSAFSGDEKGSSEPIEEPRVELKWNDVYYAFGHDPDVVVNYIVITPAKLWDEEGIVCEQSSADELAEKIGLERCMESTYEYEHKYTESQLRHLLSAFRATEKTELLS